MGNTMKRERTQAETKLDKILEYGIDKDKLNGSIHRKLNELYDFECHVSLIETDNGSLFSFKNKDDFEIILDYEKLRLDNFENPTYIKWMLTIHDSDACLHTIDENMRILDEIENIALLNNFDMVNFTTNIKLPTILTLTNKGYTLVEKSNNEDDSLSCVFLKSIIN